MNRSRTIAKEKAMTTIKYRNGSHVGIIDDEEVEEIRDNLAGQMAQMKRMNGHNWIHRI